MKARDHDVAQLVLSEFRSKMDFEEVVTFREGFM